MGNIYPRIGIGSIAAFLLHNGQEVQILDPELTRLNLDQIKSEIRKVKPDLVGLPAYTEEIHQAANLAKAIKDVNPKIITVVGGPHASAEPVQVLTEFSSFDIAVYGEGEQTMLDLTNERKTLDEIMGIAFRKGDELKLNRPRPLIKNFDTLPFPAWHLYELDKYRGSSLYSGCPCPGQRL